MYLHGVTDVSIISGSPYALEEEEAAEDTDRKYVTRPHIPPNIETPPNYYGHPSRCDS